VAANSRNTKTLVKQPDFRIADHLHRILEEVQAIVSDTLAAADLPQKPGNAVLESWLNAEIPIDAFGDKAGTNVRERS